MAVENQKKEFFKGQNIILIFKGLIPIVILASGITLLALRITGWSLLLGLPITIIGVVFLIYIYDDIASKQIGTVPEEPELTVCSVCGEPTPLLLGIAKEDTICPSCKRKIEGGMNKEKEEKK